jgi:hypothetical protein
MIQFSVGYTKMSDINNKKHSQVLKRFSRYLRQRLIRIKDAIEQRQICGKIVLRPKYVDYGRTIMKRCFGHMSKYGCYHCDPTEFSCKECGLDVRSESEKFCGGYCEWVYYGKQENFTCYYD